MDVGAKTPGQGGKPSGWIWVNRSRLEQFERLAQLRGGFAEGCRNHAAFIYATILANLGMNRAEIERKVYQMGEECRPPLSDKECQNAIKSGVEGGYKFTNKTISERLEITAEEAKQLGTWKAAAAYAAADPTPVKLTRAEKIEARRKLIRRIVQDRGGELPSTREMAKLLREHGHPVSHDTVHKDYRAMNLTAPSTGTEMQVPRLNDLHDAA